MPQRFRSWRPARPRPSIRPVHRARIPPVDPAARMRAAASWPLDECLLSEDWSAGGLVTLVWVRRHPDLPRYAVATFRADLSGGGIERSVGSVDVGRAATWDAVEAASRTARLVRCDPALAVKLLYAAVERAPAGSADPDWLWVSEILGSTDPAACPLPLPPTVPTVALRRPSRPLGERLRRTGLAMFSPVPAADA